MPTSSLLLLKVPRSRLLMTIDAHIRLVSIHHLAHTAADNARHLLAWPASLWRHIQQIIDDRSVRIIIALINSAWLLINDRLQRRRQFQSEEGSQFKRVRCVV